MADVTLKYKGATIGELSESGNKTIKTAGKYCEDDILLEYVKPQGGGTSSFTLLETKTLAENVASISFDMTGYAFDEYAIVVNATGTGADYLYFVPNGVANNFVLYKSGNNYKFIAIIDDKHNVSIGEYTINKHFLFGASPNTSVENSQQTLSSFDSLLIKAYRSAGVINAGGTFKLYGR